MNAPRILIVGIGSAHGDDQLGWQVVERLAAEFAAGWSASLPFEVRLAKSPVDLLDWLEGIDQLIVVDACRGSGETGCVRRWIWPTTHLPLMSGGGSHNYSITNVLHLATALAKLPSDVVIWSIEADPKRAIGAMSPAAVAAVPSAVQQIAREFAMTATANVDSSRVIHA